MTSQKIMYLIIVSSLAVVINLWMGCWRKTVRKYSWRWFVAIHLAVPLIFILRTEAGLGYIFIPPLVLVSLAGQLLGGKIMDLG